MGVFAASLRNPLPWVIAGIEAIHLATLFPGIGGRVNQGDSAKFQFIGKLLGVSHPPGNPLYLLINAAWVRLPWPMRTATQVTLLSTLFGAITLVFVYRTLERISTRCAACAGTIALGLGPLFWTFATEAEVYTLNTCLLAAATYHAACFAQDGSRHALLWGAFLFLLGFANHLTSIALVPAFVWLAVVGRRAGARIGARELVAVFVFALLSASLYAYVPIRVAAGARYSEFTEPLCWQSLWDYITAKKFQENFSDFSFEHGVTDRMPAFARFMQKQWIWPLLALIPLGLLRIRAQSQAFFGFLLLSLFGLSVFAFGYDIPDPAGFYMPIVTLLALAIGAALSELSGKNWPIFLGFSLCLVAAAAVHVIEWRRENGFQLVDSIGDRRKFMLWDLDDLFARIPEGARFAVPCDHYGCIEVINYYRYADPVPARRKIRFVRLPEIDSDLWSQPSPVPAVDYERARQVVVCSLRPADARQMRRRGIAVNTIVRPPRQLHGGTYPGISIYCSMVN